MSSTTILLISVIIYQALCGCYPTGAQCVPTQPFQTKITWHSCQEYCNKCKVGSTELTSRHTTFRDWLWETVLKVLLHSVMVNISASEFNNLNVK